MQDDGNENEDANAENDEDDDEDEEDDGVDDHASQDYAVEIDQLENYEHVEAGDD